MKRPVAELLSLEQTANMVKNLNRFAAALHILPEEIIWGVDGKGVCRMLLIPSANTDIELLEKELANLFTYTRDKKQYILTEFELDFFLKPPRAETNINTNLTANLLQVSTLYAAPDKSPKQTLADIYRITYQDEMRGSQGDALAIAKLAGYIVIKGLLKHQATDHWHVSYLGRKYQYVAPPHQSLFTKEIVDKIINDGATSRIHCAIVQNNLGQCVIIDLGARCKTPVTYLDENDQQQYVETVEWIHGFLTEVDASIRDEKNLSEYTALCPRFEKLKDQTTQYVGNCFDTSATILKPRPHHTIYLSTDTHKIGWLPLPLSFQYQLRIGDFIFNLNEKPHLSASLTIAQANFRTTNVGYP